MVKQAAGFVVFRRSGGIVQYLLLQKSREPYHWSPPKGHLQYDEDEYAAAVRETLEESGLHEKDLRVFKDISKTLSYDAKAKRSNEMIPKTATYWVAELVDPEQVVVLSPEHQQLEWAPFEEACTLVHYPVMKELLEYCDSCIKKLP